MKLCTKIRVDMTHVADGVHITGTPEIIDVSFVEDGHAFGVDDDGCLHIEGTVQEVRPVSAS